jgi:glutamate racemase
VLACTHFPLLEEELRAAFPGLTYVDGGPGIARRIAYLTRDQAWPPAPSDGIMLFTGTFSRPSLAMLDRYGIGEIKSL